MNICGTCTNFILDETHVVCSLHWGLRHATFLLHFAVCAIACLGSNMDLATHYCHPIGCLTSQVIAYNWRMSFLRHVPVLHGVFVRRGGHMCNVHFLVIFSNHAIGSIPFLLKLWTILQSRHFISSNFDQAGGVINMTHILEVSLSGGGEGQ